MRPPARSLAALFRPVDAASLAVFRIVFGLVMLWEISRYWSHGWVRSHFVEPKFFFGYPFFEWIKPLSGGWLEAHFDVMALAAICIVLGLFTRAAAAVFALGFAWWFLSDQTNYLNHFYLITLVSILLVFVPTERAFSLDARLSARVGAHAGTAPLWAVWLLRFQIGVPYFFGGIAKLNADWFAGEPMRMWMRGKGDLPVIGRFLGEEWAVAFFVWSGLLLDLLIVPALLWKRTRPFAYAAALSFHALNSVLFSIGIFPWLMMGATTVFFEPGWPRRFLPAKFRKRASPVASAEPVRLTPARHAGLAAIGGWVAFQCLVPMRHLVYPGYVSWTEEGHLYAWHMKLRDKHGSAEITATEPATGRSWKVDPRDQLTRKQAAEMIEHPEMLLQFARHLAREHEAGGQGRLEIRARVMMSVNGRRPQLFIDPEVDLASQPFSLAPREWILPLTEPLRRRRGLP